MTPETRRMALILTQSAIASANALLKILRTGSDAECQQAVLDVSHLLMEDATRLMEVYNASKSS